MLYYSVSAFRDLYWPYSWYHLRCEGSNPGKALARHASYMLCFLLSGDKIILIHWLPMKNSGSKRIAIRTLETTIGYTREREVHCQTFRRNTLKRTHYLEVNLVIKSKYTKGNWGNNLFPSSSKWYKNNRNICTININIIRLNQFSCNI